MTADEGRMKGHGEKLSRKMEQAIAALLSAKSVSDAAGTIGVSEVTLGRWMKRSDFREAFRSARKEAVGQAIAKVQAAMNDAVEALRGVMADTAAPAGARVSAARAIIDNGLQAAELEDLEKRLDDLEERLAAEAKGTADA